MPFEQKLSVLRDLSRLRGQWIRAVLPLVTAVTLLGGGGLAALETDTVAT